jgi:hypothetical protein
MTGRRNTLLGFIAVQLIAVAVVAGSLTATATKPQPQSVATTSTSDRQTTVSIDRSRPFQITPLYDDPEIVSDVDLAAVLERVRPRFPRSGLKPNYVEHALRTWSVAATFEDPAVLSGAEMRDFLTDHGKFLASWSAQENIKPLLEDRTDGIAIRFDRKEGGSVHHDHWLACLTEAGVALNHRVYGPSRRDMTVGNVLQEALRDFRLDERETEWSAMAFGLWLVPATPGQKAVRSWQTGDGRRVSFDMLAERLIRGHGRFGVCGGTHRVYSLMLLWRLDEEFDILTPRVQDAVFAHLESVRDLITASQYEDGHWRSDWSRGKLALENPVDDAEYRRVIMTGHHLEWLSIAPVELHPPREVILKAARWIVKTTIEHSAEEVRGHFTFYSHVGNALAMWRKTSSAHFWRDWRKTHPFDPYDAPQKNSKNTIAGK